MNHINRSGKIRLFAMATLFGGLLVAGNSGAVTRNYAIVFDPATVTCGINSITGGAACGSQTVLDLPLMASIGDVFNVSVTTLSGAPLVVPGSAVENGIYVSFYNALATFENGGPGPVRAKSLVVPLGLITTAIGPPFGGPQVTSQKNGYLGAAGYSTVFGAPNHGFSVTGLNASLEVVTPDVLPTIGISVGYYWRPDPVPEPATWAMMIMGFGLAGAALRRRGVNKAKECMAKPTASLG